MDSCTYSSLTSPDNSVVKTKQEMLRGLLITHIEDYTDLAYLKTIVAKATRCALLRL